VKVHSLLLHSRFGVQPRSRQAQWRFVEGHGVGLTGKWCFSAISSIKGDSESETVDEGAWWQLRVVAQKEGVWLRRLKIGSRL
jgi:hypothetical protein